MTEQEHEEALSVIQSLWQDFRRSPESDAAWFCILREYDLGLVLCAVQRLTRAKVYRVPTINQLVEEVTQTLADQARKTLEKTQAEKRKQISATPRGDAELGVRTMRAIQWISDAGKIRDTQARAAEIAKRRAKVFDTLNFQLPLPLQKKRKS